MRSKLFLLIVFNLTALPLTSQSLINDFGNNRVTTSSIVFTADDRGRPGLYTSEILESFKIPNITILQMYQNVRSIVSRVSNNQQLAWESTSFTGDFYFSIDTIRR